jgi:hypothetical protein
LLKLRRIRDRRRGEAGAEARRKEHYETEEEQMDRLSKEKLEDTLAMMALRWTNEIVGELCVTLCCYDL